MTVENVILAKGEIRMMNENKRKAIVKKVASVLENTDNVVKMHIGIFADSGEVPVIRYSIEENIRPETEFDEGYAE